jgi:uncharacterized protein (TIGR02246 family)
MFEPDAMWEAADTVARFTLALDARDAERVATLFAADAVLHAPDGTHLTGRDAILAHYRRGVREVGETQHFLTNGVRELGADGIEHSWWYTLIVAEHAPGSGRHRLMTGRYAFRIRTGTAPEILELRLSLERTLEFLP